MQGMHIRGWLQPPDGTTHKSPNAGRALLNYRTQNDAGEAADGVLVTEDGHRTGLIRLTTRASREPPPAC